MTNSKKQTQSKRRGQGMTEYILIVSLIAIASIGVTTLFGNNLRNLFGMAADVLAGQDNVTNRNVENAGTDATLVKRNLKNAALHNSSTY